MSEKQSNYENQSEISNNSQTKESSYNDNQTTKVTVEEYLSKLICTGCSKRCSLLSPLCGKGIVQAKSAIEKYNLEYNSLK